MATSAYEFRLTNRKLAVSLVLAVVPLSLFAILTITQHSEVMEKSVGSQSQATAEGIAAEINQFVRGHVIEANLMASDSAVVATVQAANRASANLTDAALKAKIERWHSPLPYVHRFPWGWGWFSVGRCSPSSSEKNNSLRHQLAGSGSCSLSCR